MAIALHSFQRYLNAGVHVALGTDTFPMDMVAELRWASMLAKITDQNYQVGQPRDVYNAATLGACTFLGRDDLGRLAPGAKADILLINLDHLGSAFYTDPIKALVDFGCGRDVDTVIVDGKTLIQGGDVVHVDEAEVYANAQQATHRFWSQIPTWHWGGCNLEEIVPPAYPIHRTSVATSSSL
jgi:cytosine/adenosine deaminase-related metal-dependent hydrolase